ncbi:MAG: hypothetical protein EOP47_22815 [Sphingobacteriaceae bacterium]|nr:MAG: hypothetical protein EOP47_22815 [Sphingobacteriaceae bacterium]
MNAYNDENNDKPNAYRVEDDDNLKEEDLKRTFLGGEMKDANAPGMESHGEGGHKFGENNQTPSGDDKNNPSQYAGNTNEYFRRSEPSQEVTQNNNFKADSEGYVEGTSDNDGTDHDDTQNGADYLNLPDLKRGDTEDKELGD